MKQTYTYVLALLMMLSLSCENESSILELNELESTEVRASVFNDSDNEIISCNTAFAKGTDSRSTCFTEDGFNRWGWTIGPLSGGEYTFDIYAGAGQCDTNKGDLAGTLEVNYNQETGTAEVTYVANSNYSFSETHLYIGNNPYPTVRRGKKVTNTVAPGRFPYKNDNLVDGSIDSYTIDNLSGPIYVIAHSVACLRVDDGVENDDPTNEEDETDSENDEQTSCSDCLGTVTNLTLRYLANTSTEVKIIQSDGRIVFLETVVPSQEISFTGLNSDGSFGSGIQIFINDLLDGEYITDCTDFIGPGFPGGSFVVSDGISSEGGILCPIDIF